MKKRVLISIMLIVTLCLLTSCQKTTGNEHTSGTTAGNEQTSGAAGTVGDSGNKVQYYVHGQLMTEDELVAYRNANSGKNQPDLLESDPDKMVAISDSDIAKLRIGMTRDEVKKILKEKFCEKSSSTYPVVLSWKMSDGDFIVITFEIEGCETYDDYLKALEKAVFGDDPIPDKPYRLSDEQFSRELEFIRSARVVSASRQSNGEILIGKTDN